MSCWFDNKKRLGGKKKIDESAFFQEKGNG